MKKAPVIIILILALAGLVMASITDEELLDMLPGFYHDWQGDKTERLIVIADDQVFMFPGGDKHHIFLPFGEILRSLSRKGLRFGQVTHIIHNHAWPEGFSSTDRALVEALSREGFTGRFMIYYPDVRRLKTMTYR
jgi:hypothetical protein